MSDSPADQTKKLIAELWERNQPLILERLDLLDAAAAAAQSGSLPEEQRAEAESVAHKLSGSLGMFGYQGGTSIAQVLEAELQSQSPDGSKLSALARELRDSLFPIVTS